MPSTTSAEAYIHSPLDTPTIPEYFNCRICDARIGEQAGRTTGRCKDCQFIHRPYANQWARRNGIYTPDFQLTYHFAPATKRHTSNHVPRDLRTINAAGLGYAEVNIEDDPVAHYYISDVLRYTTYPVTTITRGTELIDHWAGMNPTKLRQWANESARQKKAAQASGQVKRGRPATRNAA